ncbi:MAPK/MAK/MRK overlapping kinase-like isoform X3 [Branchiostoma floridae x Branchiostoma japonicum]
MVELGSTLMQATGHQVGGSLQARRARVRAVSDFALGNILRSHEYRILGKKGEGTFSEVLKCQSIKDGQYYACKKMKQHYDSVEQINNLREIQAMRRLHPHANVIELIEVIFDKKTGTLALVCELMDMNIYELIRGRRHYLPELKVKNYMYQLCKSLDHMHRNGIFHRDVKPENILVRDDLLKLADFGSCRSVYSKQPYTEYISTRWYRAPECLLTDGYYSYKMDLWSAGCVFFEIMSLHPLFPGSNEVDQIAKIHDIMGTPDQSVLNKLRNKTRGMNFNFPPKKGSGINKLLPHASPESIDLIYQMCTYDPDERITAKQALRHPYFKDMREAEKRQAALQKVENRAKNADKAGGDRPGSGRTEISRISDTTTRTEQLAQQRRRVSYRHLPNLMRRNRRLEAQQANHQTGFMLPKVPQSNALSIHSTTFPNSSFPTHSIVPKLPVPGATSTSTSTMLPAIMSSHPQQKARKPKNHQLPTKNVFGHYQLPSIDRRGAGF